MGLRQLLDLSPEDREKLVKSGKAWCQRFTWEDSANKYLELYHELNR